MTAADGNVLNFEYDAAERVGKETYLTPLYFNKQVLIRYLYDSRFTCDFVSETYGNIGGEEFQIDFGISRQGSVIAWLGDLMEKLPLREQRYWLIENKAPEGDARSEFYDAQINSEFTEPPAAVACLNELARLNAAFHQRFGVHLYRQASVEERIEETRRYKRLILNNEDDFKRLVSQFSEIINESANHGELERLLTDWKIPAPKGSKGNKLLELVYKHCLGDTENLIAPFFYLYDLRIWADHAGAEGKRDAVAAALGVANTDYNALMAALLAAMESSCIKLLAKITA